MPEALPAVTVPFLSNAGRSFVNVSSVVPCLGYSSSETTTSPLRPLDRDGRDLVLEPAGLLRGLGLVLRGHRELVLLFARDLPFLGDVLGRRAHVIAMEGVPQTVLDHRVDHLGIAHLGAAAQIHRMRRLAHTLLTARDDDIAVAVADRLEAERHRAQAGAAELVDAIGGLLDRDARADRGLARRVLALSGREDLAEDRLVDVAGCHVRALHRLEDRDLTEIVGRHARERAVEAAHGCTRRGGDDDIGHWVSPVLEF